MRGPLDKYFSETSTERKNIPIFICSLVSASHKKIPKFPTFVATHQADVPRPPVGRGPQVENRWARPYLVLAHWSGTAAWSVHYQRWDW